MFKEGHHDSAAVAKVRGCGIVAYLLNVVKFMKVFFRDFEIEKLNVGCKPVSVSTLGQHTMSLLHILPKSYP